MSPLAGAREEDVTNLSIRDLGDLHLVKSSRSPRKELGHMYISVVTLFVNDIDRAIKFYTEKLAWEKTMDVPMGPDARWVTVAPPGAKTSFTLAKGTPAWSPDKVGGFSGVIMEVDDVHQTHKDLQKLGIEFAEPPRSEPWGGWAMFKDSEGNVHGLHSPVPVNGTQKI
jgi:lactoylglutathione lyase